MARSVAIQRAKHRFLLDHSTHSRHYRPRRFFLHQLRIVDLAANDSCRQKENRRFPVPLYCSRSQLSGFEICWICARRFFVLPVKKKVIKSAGAAASFPPK
jgi:hypothetical protein